MKSMEEMIKAAQDAAQNIQQQMEEAQGKLDSIEVVVAVLLSFVSVSVVSVVSLAMVVVTVVVESPSEEVVVESVETVVSLVLVVEVLVDHVVVDETSDASLDSELGTGSVECGCDEQQVGMCDVQAAIAVLTGVQRRRHSVE